MEFKNAIALTGGIATGKSTVSNFLKLHGFLIIDADKIAHEMLHQNSKTIGAIFGERYVVDGTVDRKRLGELIFSNLEAKIKLQDFLHPLIKNEIINQSLLFEAQNKPYIIDIPLFFETRNYDIAKNVVVYAPQELQIQRLIKRDKISLEVAKQKIANQMDIEEKKQLAQFVIDNSSNIKHLQKQVDIFLKDIL